MPCIRTTTSCTINESQRKELEQYFGKAIETIPGKSETWLMLVFQDQTPVCFAGNDSAPAAYVEVSILGKASSTVFDTLTEKICSILNNVLQIPQDRIYVKYEECSNWGWNGSNF